MTGLTPPEHEHTAAIDEAAEWYATTPRRHLNRPIIPTLRERFGLSNQEAVQAVREANLIRARPL